MNRLVCISPTIFSAFVSFHCSEWLTEPAFFFNSFIVPIVCDSLSEHASIGAYWGFNSIFFRIFVIFVNLLKLLQICASP